MIDSHPIIARLKQHIEALAPSQQGGGRSRISFGLDRLDAALDGGLARGAVHEILPATPGDAVSAAAFALMIALRAAETQGMILWITTDAQMRGYGVPYGPGLADLGLAPDRVLLVTVPDEQACLKAAGDAAACAGLSAAMIDLGETRRLDLTASRKLALASERSGVTALVLRHSHGVIASAAATRWQIAAAPAQPWPGQAPGRTSLAVALVRHRGGRQPFEMVVEWNNDDRCFCDPTVLRGVSAPVERRQMVA